MDKKLFREFITEEEAKKWAKENYGQWLNDIQITKYSYTSKEIRDLFKLLAINQVSSASIALQTAILQI